MEMATQLDQKVHQCLTEMAMKERGGWERESEREGEIVGQKQAQVDRRGEGEPVKATGSMIGLQRICNINSGKRKVNKVIMNQIL